MASNMFAKMVQRQWHRIIVALVYAFLEWNLMLLLFLNFFFSFLASKFADHFGLKPCCKLCSRLDHPKSHLGHVCEAHGTEFFRLTYCFIHQRLAESTQLCKDCSVSKPAHDGKMDQVAFLTCSCCDEALDRKGCDGSEQLKPCWNILDRVEVEDDATQCRSSFQADQTVNDQRTDFECSDPFWNEEEESGYATDVVLQNADCVDSDEFICIELIDSVAKTSASCSDDVVEDKLPMLESKGQEKALNRLYAELEEERKAAAVAANETMAMIMKLQEEKAAMRMEAVQYQRMMEEQAEYDQEALQLLNDLMIKREKEKQELEKEVEAYRNKVLFYEARERISIGRSREGSFWSGQGGNGPSQDPDQHELDIRQELNLEERGVQCMTSLIIPDISLAEFDEERLSILDELRALEAKLFAFCDNEVQTSEGVRGTSDQLTDSYSLTDNVVTKKLLPNFDAADHGKEFNKEKSSAECQKSKGFIQEELSHAYERLQALDTDMEFLKHCMSSMAKGNDGLALLQEILQHLRGLRTVEVLPARNLDELISANAV